MPVGVLDQLLRLRAREGAADTLERAGQLAAAIGRGAPSRGAAAGALGRAGGGALLAPERCG